MELIPRQSAMQPCRQQGQLGYNEASVRNGRHPHWSTMTVDRRHTGKRLSELVINRASGTAYLAGQVADDPSADITGQMQQVLAQIDDLLFEAGTDKSKILSATIYLPDMGDFAAMNAVWEKWVVPGQTPARATVEAKLAAPNYRVEIQIVAATPIPA
jgi:enamine deaminase RidA (YjgF/YER057c/UK114 family)